jgi:predicted RNase H-like HicB family nuclease
MQNLHIKTKKGGNSMKTYYVPVVIEPDEDKWSAYVPGMIEQGATSWGETKEEAMQHIQEVAQMIIEELLEEGEKLPSFITESNQEVVAVNL